MRRESVWLTTIGAISAVAAGCLAVCAGQTGLVGRFREQHARPAFTKASSIPGSDVPIIETGTGSTSREPVTTPRVPDSSVVKVFYATDRKRMVIGSVVPQYGNEWSGALEYGVAEITIPTDHRIGIIESPRIWRFEFRRNSAKHVTVSSPESMDYAAFAAGIRSGISAARTADAGGDLLLFVHGFNVSFEDALMRTGQIFYDLDLPGVPVAYCWPSQGQLNPVAYMADTNMTDVTAPLLKDFLVGLARDTGATRIHVIAHSMGNRVLTRALDAIVSDVLVQPKPRFNNIALTAPDLDARVVIEISKRIDAIAGRITLYASDNDEALKIASRYTRSRRAGQAGKQILVLKNIDTIDASDVDTSLVGHFYYGSNLSVLSDLYYLFLLGEPPDRRFLLRPVDSATGRYWAFKRTR